MSTVQTRSLVVVFIGLAATGLARLAPAQQESTDSAAVVAAASAWLTLVDEAQYAVSLDSAAPLLRQMTGSVDGWRQFLAQARAGLVTPPRRQLVASDADASFPGAPPGRYWSLAYLLDGGPATETVVLVSTASGWKVAMYGVRGG